MALTVVNTFIINETITDWHDENLKLRSTRDHNKCFICAIIHTKSYQVYAVI